MLGAGVGSRDGPASTRTTPPVAAATAIPISSGEKVSASGRGAPPAGSAFAGGAARAGPTRTRRNAIPVAARGRVIGRPARRSARPAAARAPGPRGRLGSGGWSATRRRTRPWPRPADRRPGRPGPAGGASARSDRPLAPPRRSSAPPAAALAQHGLAAGQKVRAHAPGLRGQGRQPALGAGGRPAKAPGRPMRGSDGRLPAAGLRGRRGGCRCGPWPAPGRGPAGVVGGGASPRAAPRGGRRAAPPRGRKVCGPYITAATAAPAASPSSQARGAPLARRWPAPSGGAQLPGQRPFHQRDAADRRGHARAAAGKTPPAGRGRGRQADAGRRRRRGRRLLADALGGATPAPAPRPSRARAPFRTARRGRPSAGRRPAWRSATP